MVCNSGEKGKTMLYPQNQGAFYQAPYQTGYMQQPYNYGQVQRPMAPNNNMFQQPAMQQIVPMNGMVVSSENDIRVQDVPQDGSVGWFPLSDYTAIYAKSWGNDGKITTVKYVPEVIPIQDAEVISVDPQKYDEIIERLDKIEGMLKPKRPSRSKTETESE